MSDQDDQSKPKNTLNRKLDSLGWGLFLIKIGGLWLAPDGSLPESTWLVGTGIIILGLCLIRFINNIKVNGFIIFLGILALGSGLSDILGMDLPVFPILLIIIGATIILKPIIQKNENQKQ